PSVVATSGCAGTFSSYTLSFDCKAVAVVIVAVSVLPAYTLVRIPGLRGAGAHRRPGILTSVYAGRTETATMTTATALQSKLNVYDENVPAQPLVATTD